MIVGSMLVMFLSNMLAIYPRLGQIARKKYWQPFLLVA